MVRVIFTSEGLSDFINRVRNGINANECVEISIGDMLIYLRVLKKLESYPHITQKDLEEFASTVGGAAHEYKGDILTFGPAVTPNLALSGGGIRSVAYNMGVLEGLKGDSRVGVTAISQGGLAAIEVLHDNGSELVIEIETPEHATNEGALSVIERLVTEIDGLHRAMGGHGLKVNDLQVHQDSNVPAEVR